MHWWRLKQLPLQNKKRRINQGSCGMDVQLQTSRSTGTVQERKDGSCAFVVFRVDFRGLFLYDR